MTAARPARADEKALLKRAREIVQQYTDAIERGAVEVFARFGLPARLP